MLITTTSPLLSNSTMDAANEKKTWGYRNDINETKTLNNNYHGT